MTDPTLAELLEAIAALEPLDRTAARFGIPRELVVQRLRAAAETSGFTPPAAVRARLVTTLAPAPETALVAVPSGRATLYSDGASRGNPGPAGAGAVLVLPDGKRLKLGRFLGVQTNNVAEYQGVILGLEKAVELGLRQLDIKADSMLAMMQLKGEWKLKHEGLKPYFERAKKLIAQLDDVRFQHIPREQNGAADEMSNRAIGEMM